MAAEADQAVPQRRVTRLRSGVRRGGGTVYVSRPRLSTPPGPAIHEAEATLESVATFASEAALATTAEASLQAVATIAPDASQAMGAEASLQAVATFEAEGLIPGPVEFIDQRRTTRYRRTNRRGAWVYVSRGRSVPVVVQAGEATLEAVATATADGSAVSLADTAVDAVATFTSDGLLTFQGVAALTGVAEFTADADLTIGPVTGEGSFQSVATLTADGSLVQQQGALSAIGVASFAAEPGFIAHAEAELVGVARFTADPEGVLGETAVLQGVAYMAFDPEHTSRRTTWVRGSRGSFYPSPNRRRVRGSATEVRGRRVIG